MVKLVDEAELLPTQAGALLIAHGSGRPRPHIDLAAIGLFQQARKMEQGRFACAGRSHEGHDLAGPDREIGSAQHFEKAVRLRIAALDLGQVQGGFLG
jgi:hypothetical protein